MSSETGMAPSKVKFFAGAPLDSQIDWTSNILTNEWSAAFCNYLMIPQLSGLRDPSPMTVRASWREVSVSNKTFYETPIIKRIERPSSFISPFKTDYEDYLAHSFAILDNLQSSQIEPQASASVAELETTFLTTTSFATSTTEDSNLSTTLSDLDHSALCAPGEQTLSIAGPVSNINTLPSPSHLFRLRPQTMTINLIVGIISISPAKTVTVRRGNYTMDVIEMLVGDETKAGFSISTWLPAGKTLHAIKDEMRQKVLKLRSGDVVLIERLALSTFRDQVFGQTLNRKATKNTTRFVVLEGDFRNNDSSVDGTVSSAVVSKIRRVRDWVDAFVGLSRKRKLEASEGGKGKRVARETSIEEYLPPDTQ